MPSITTWTRLEPHSRAEDMEASLEMRVHDPLWMLARQWQFGEFKGEDAGTPVWAAFNGVQMPLGLYLPGSLEGHVREDVQEYAANVPLEFRVERERIPALTVLVHNRRLAVDAGQHLLRLLGSSLTKKYRANLLQNYKIMAISDDERLALDADSRAFLDLMAGRVLDGARILETIQQSEAADRTTRLGFGSDDEQAADKAIKAWLDWCERMIGSVSSTTVRQSAWNPERMEYACALAAPGMDPSDKPIVLTAAEYPGGHLDWYSFDTITHQNLKGDIAIQPQSFGSGTLPTPLSFRGKPANRLWEFEDTQVSFGSIQAAPTDLARMLLVEFLIEYGNDFFTIPIMLETGSLYNLSQLKVINTFGDETIPAPFAETSWRMFVLSDDLATPSTPPSSTLFLPPALGPHFASPPIEDLHLLRDEMANVAWAVEHLVQSVSGLPLNRHEAYQAQRQQSQSQEPPLSEGTLTYSLDTWNTAAPDYWIPLLPEQPAPGQSPLRLACYDPQGRSQGLLLSEHAPGGWLYIFDTEIPRSGARITRTQQYTRWYGGGMFAWIGREKRSGRGEGSSNLRYDTVSVASSS